MAEEAKHIPQTVCKLRMPLNSVAVGRAETVLLPLGQAAGVGEFTVGNLRNSLHETRP